MTIIRSTLAQLALVVLAINTSTRHAFTASPRVTQSLTTSITTDSTSQLNAYVPDELTEQEYSQLKKREQAQRSKADYARLGPRGFKSRSMEGWQKAYEQGKAKHNFAPVSMDKKKMSKKDLPYMVRGGSWDNSDLGFAFRLPWSKTDRDYARGGYKKEQSVSILGSGPGLDWTGTRKRGDNDGKRIMPGFS